MKRAISQSKQIMLKEALSHMHIAELKNELQILNLSTKGFNKEELINRIMHYVITSKELPPLQIPATSKAQRGKTYPLTPETRMMYGAYKNDLRTRQFFKQLIGNHFHFTAYGVDWLRERWLAGNPPTYAEFAQEWQAEYERNKKKQRPAKQEWAYIRFVQQYMETHPHASKQEVTAAWNNERKRLVNEARKILHLLCNKKSIH